MVYRCSRGSLTKEVEKDTGHNHKQGQQKEDETAFLEMALLFGLELGKVLLGRKFDLDFEVLFLFAAIFFGATGIFVVLVSLLAAKILIRALHDYDFIRRFGAKNGAKEEM